MGGGKGGGGGDTSTTTTSEPWAAQKPYLEGAIIRAAGATGGGWTPYGYHLPFGGSEAGLYNTAFAPNYYSGNTLASQDPYTTQAINLQAQRALAGSPVTDSAQNMLTSTLNGDYLTEGNPYLDQMVNRAQNQSLASVAGNFSQAGRYGSGAHNAAAQDAAGNIATQMYGQAYDNERTNQLRAAAMAPQMAQQDYQDLMALSEAGTARENYAQDLINADIDRYNYNAQIPLTALQNYMSLIQGSYGGTTTATGQQASGKSNPLGGAMGGALSGAGIGTAIMPGLGTAIGGIGGGLLGLLGSL